MDAFKTSLDLSAASHLPSKARRIAALLPQIEAAMAQGSSRAHIVAGLLGVGIEVTPHQLSNVIARVRSQRERSAAVQLAQPAPMACVIPTIGTKVSTGRTAPEQPAAWPVSIPTLGSVPNTSSTSSNSISRFGAHDPRLLDEVMRSTPDMKALAKLAPKLTNQGKP